MREEIADLVHPVLAYGLDLKVRLGRGEPPPLEAEQAALLGLLQGEREARRWPDFGGEPAGQPPAEDAGPPASDAPPRPARFLGARYALACWLDELFVLDSPWGVRWNERKLEVALYGSNDRAWKFWDQAALAATRGGDALEAFFLCVMLGFRGELSGEPERLREWVAAARARVAGARAREWAGPPDLEPPTNVPPLRGRQQLRNAVLAAGLALLALVPALAFLLARRLG